MTPFTSECLYRNYACFGPKQVFLKQNAEITHFPGFMLYSHSKTNIEATMFKEATNFQSYLLALDSAQTSWCSADWNLII